MANNLTRTAEDGLLNLLLAGTTFTITTPIKVRLMTANGSDTSAGTELGTSGGYTAGGSTITWNTVSAGASSNSADVSWTNMPATTITGIEIWSSDGTPKRLWYGAMAANKTTASGDTFTLPAGQVTVSLN